MVEGDLFWDALGEMEEVAGIVDGFYLLQTWEIGTVIGLLPVGQVRVDVVHVGASAGVGAHCLPGVGQPGLICRCDGGGIARIPVGGVLGGEESAAVHPGRGSCGHAADRAAKCVEAAADPT